MPLPDSHRQPLLPDSFASVRPIVGMFFAFSIQLLLAEGWINYIRSPGHQQKSLL
jgi:hypothetical protein